MTRIRSFAVFASLFLAAPAFADTAATSSSDQPKAECSKAKADTAKAEEAAPAKTRRLTARERWLGTPRTRAVALPEESDAFILPRMSDPTQAVTFQSSNPELQTEVLDKALPLPSLGTGGAF